MVHRSSVALMAARCGAGLRTLRDVLGERTMAGSRVVESVVLSAKASCSTVCADAPRSGRRPGGIARAATFPDNRGVVGVRRATRP